MFTKTHTSKINYFIIKTISIFIVFFITASLYSYTIKGIAVGAYDGDTIKVLVKNEKGNLKQYKVQLMGIDAPEKEQNYGFESRNHLLSLIGNKEITVKYEKKDTLGRILGKVYCNYEYINEKMIRNGYAWYSEKKYPASIILAIAQEHAQKSQSALWKQVEPIPPWNWKKVKKKNKQYILQNVINSTVKVITPKTVGTGFLISRNGEILTNYHVVANQKNIRVELKNGTTKNAIYYKTTKDSKKMDIVMLKIKGSYSNYLKLAKYEPKINDNIFVVGHPYGYDWTLSKGYVTGYQGTNPSNIQISANISPGNSGSAICNTKGEVVGIAKTIELNNIKFNIGYLVYDPTNVLYFGLSLNGIKSFLRNLSN
jgi:micrococcal nuclease